MQAGVVFFIESCVGSGCFVPCRSVGKAGVLILCGIHNPTGVSTIPTSLKGEWAGRVVVVATVDVK